MTYSLPTSPPTIFQAGGSVSGTGTGSPSGGAGNSSASVSSVGPPNLPTPVPATVSLDAAPSSPAQLNIEADFLGAHNTQVIAGNAVSAAQGYIATLNTLAASLNPPSINPNFPAILTAPAIAAPVAPAIQTAVFNPPPLPGAFSGAVPGINSFPVFTATPPTLLFPNAPTAPNPTLPSAPGVNLNFAYPTVNVALPPVPALMSVETQQFNGVTFPTLSATAPVLTAVAPSVTSFIPAAPYTDALLSSLTTSLKSRIDISNTGVNTGLPPAVEQGIWNREREREYRQQADAITALDRMEAMGYAFAPGTFIDAQIKIQTETGYVLAGASRDVATAQAKLEQDNIKMALDSAITIEGKLIDYANQTEQRRFEAAKYATEAGVAIYNAQVQAYQAMVQTYRAAIDVYVAQINGARAQVEIYQAEIAAERLKVDINTALIQQYKIQVDAALASIEVFKGQISIIQTEAQIEQLKVSIFGEQVRAYATQAQLYQAQVEGYKAAIEAEGQKEQVYATSANVYGSLVQATAKQIDSKLDVFKSQLSAKTLEYDAYKAQVQSEAERVRAIAAQNQSVAAIYSANVQGTTGYNETLVKEYQTSIDISEKVAQIGVAAAEASGKLYLSAASIATDAAKVGAQVEAQIAASALGAVTYATHRARQDNVGFSTSVGFNQSKQLSQSSAVNSGTSTSVSYGTSTSLSSQISSSTTFNTNVAEAQ